MKKILSKILDEINKETPRLDYIRGLIEASIEDDGLELTILKRSDEISSSIINNKSIIKSDEEIIPDFVKAGPIGKITS